ncbi:MAG: nitroreductase family protein [Clostridia bacterium]|nr:nitroreductase family protein [Clostridia bacterium]
MKELLKSRRSIRKYKDTKIDREVINHILQCGLLSPTSRNSKPWEIYLTEDKEKIEKLSRSKDSGSAFIKDAPLVVVLAADPDRSGVWIEDLSIMATIMHLEAHQLGIGSCWVQIRGRDHSPSLSAEDYIKEVMDIAENRKILCLISFGIPDEEKKSYTDEDILSDRIIWR